MRKFFAPAAVILALLSGVGGCVERILTVDSDPPGAIVELNGQEMKGRTPVTQDFTWYGTYDVTLRLDNYQTLKTTARIFPPIYLWIPFDLVADILPVLIKDHHTVHFALNPQPPASGPSPGILNRAAELKRQMETTHYPNEPKSK